MSDVSHIAWSRVVVRLVSHKSMQNAGLGSIVVVDPLPFPCMYADTISELRDTKVFCLLLRSFEVVEVEVNNLQKLLQGFKSAGTFLPL